MTSPAIELGAAYLSILGSTRDLVKSVPPALRQMQRYADAHPLQVRADVDVSHVRPVNIPVDTSRFGAQMRDAIGDAQRYARTHAIDVKADIDVSHIKAISVPVRADTSRLDRDVRSTRTHGDNTITTTAQLDPTPARLEMALLRRQLSADPVAVGVHLDSAGVATALAAGATAGAAEVAPDVGSLLQQQVESGLEHVDVTALTDRLREQLPEVFADIGGPVDIDMAAATARLEELTRDRRIRIGVDVEWRTVLVALAALVALRRMVKINVTIPVADLIRIDATLAELVRPRDTQINVDVDQSTAATAESRLDAIARNRDVRLDVDSAALVGLAALGNHTVRLDVEIDQDSLTTVNAALAHIARDRTVTFHPDIDAASAQATEEILNRLARRREIEFGLNLDRSDAARMELLLRLLSRDRNVRFGIDGLGHAGSQADSTNRSLTSMSAIKFTGLAAGIGALIPLLLGVAGAAAGAAGALIVGLAALGPAAAAAGATVAVAMQGIGDAFKALAAADAAPGDGGQAKAKAVASAQDQVKSALESVESAQRDLTNAQKDAETAQTDLGQAYKDAADELEDYQLKLKDAALSEKEAALAVREARDDIAKAKTPAEREKAILRLERAELRYLQAVEANRDTQEEAATAQAKGIEGSDKVVTAKDRAAQADQRVADAQKSVTKAYEQVAKAQQAVTDAASASSASSAQDKAAQALAKLSPNAQAFVLAARELGPAWKELQQATQDSLFEGSAQGIKDLATAALPTLKAGMVEVAGSMNGLTKQFAAFWAAPENLEGVRAAFSGAHGFIDGLGPGLQQATQGFLSLSKAFEPVANKVGADVAGLLGNIGQAFTDAFESGALTQLISTFGDILRGLGEGLRPLIGGLIEMGNIVGPTIGPLFKQLGESIALLAPSLGALGATFIKTLTTLLPPVQRFIDALAKGLEPVLPVLGTLLDHLVTALIPLIGPLSDIAIVVGNALIQAIDALAPAVGPLAAAFASLVSAVAPLLPMVAEIVSGIIQALAPALKTVFDALKPVIQAFSDALLPVFRELQPVLTETAQKLGDALAAALTALAPLIPQIVEAFGGLLVALVPLLPQLAEIAVQLLPPLVELFVECYPALLKLIDAFTWLVNTVMPILLPAMQAIIEVQADFLKTLVDVVRFVKEHFGPAMSAIGGFFSDIGSAVSEQWDMIVHGIARSVKVIGQLLQRLKIPDWVPGVGGKGTVGLGDSLVEWADAHLAVGGLLHGKGSGTSDSMLIAASHGEFVVNAKSTAATLPLLEAINAGWVPSAKFLHGMIPGFAKGGLAPGKPGGGVPGKKFAESMDPVPYQMGGFSRTSIDCSGMVAAVVNDALGKDPFTGRMSTVNEGTWLTDLGAQQGLGGAGDISIGWYDRGGGANGHTAMTLGDGTNVESNGSDGVVVGAAAAGAADPMFDHHMHLPAALLRGGDLGGPATTSTLPGPAGTGTTGTGTGTGTGGLSGTGGATGAGGAVGDATRVFVVNWPGTTNPASTNPAATPADLVPTPGSMVPAADLAPGATLAAPGPWWEADNPQQAIEQLGAALAPVDVGGRALQGLSDFAGANINDALGTLGIRSSGGAIQELVSVIQDYTASQVAEALRRSRTQAASFVGRR